MCYSGDFVTMDEDGFLYFVGRRDTMIKSSGFRISPTEVEEVLFKSGLVRAAAVIGIPDEVLGQTIKAFVVRRDGEALAVEKLRGVLRGEHAALHGAEGHRGARRAAEDDERQGGLSGAAPARGSVGGSWLSIRVAALIAQHFPDSKAELRIGGIPVGDIAARYGTPFFVYDRQVLDRKWALLRDALPAEFSIAYSVKANPNPAIIRYFLAKGASLEIASPGEMARALAGGLPGRAGSSSRGRARRKPSSSWRSSRESARSTSSRSWRRAGSPP